MLYKHIFIYINFCQSYVRHNYIDRFALGFLNSLRPIISYLNSAEKAAKVCQEISDKGSGSAEFLLCDLLNEENIKVGMEHG